MYRNISCISGDEMSEASNFHMQSTANLYTQSEIDDFISHICNTVNNRLENSQNELQGSGWIVQEISDFKINFCRFTKGILGDLKPYPQGLGGSHQIFNPRTSENCVLTVLAAFEYYKEHPNTEACVLNRKIIRNLRKFWQDRINIGGLNSESIGWDSLSELEKLNNVSFVIDNSSLLNHNSRKYCIQLEHHSRSNYEKVPLLLI